jgi:energy-converting hydrogenase A subunit M
MNPEFICHVIVEKQSCSGVSCLYCPLKDGEWDCLDVVDEVDLAEQWLEENGAEI